jgi:carotenoid 1,2-hydratase
MSGPAAAAGARPDLGFSRPVPRDGYAWWYVDALSDDGRHGLTVIAFVGSVFSPYYAGARRRGRGDPAHHCALNVVLSGPGGGRWTMTERGRADLVVRPDGLGIGPSSVSWDGEAFEISIDETAVPVPRRVRGVVRVRPSMVTPGPIALDAAGRHRWWPIAPRCRVEVDLSSPHRSWRGSGYLDTNSGDEPLEDGFAEWDWSRADLGDGPDGGAAILYEPVRRDGSRHLVAVRVAPDGTVQPFEAPPRAELPSAPWWRMRRATRSEPGHAPRVRATLVDAPFYARSVVSARLLGRPVEAVHESLSLDRFRARWVQVLLPFRMPRIARGRPSGPSGADPAA